MKRFALFTCVALVFLGSSGIVDAGFGDSASYSGHQPWWNPFAWFRRPKLTPEEERLQRFWHDYYDSLQHYYGNLDHLDWVAFYKNHGYQINQGGGYYGNGPYGYGLLRDHGVWRPLQRRRSADPAMPR